MNLRTWLFFVFLTGSLVAFTQEGEQVVSGTVTDAVTGEPLPGANVSIPGVPYGLTTDSSGLFRLKNLKPGTVISFSCIGHEVNWVTYNGQPVIDIGLQPSVTALDEVVVVGYGVIKKSDLTGAISGVSSAEIEKAAPGNIQSVIEGRVPGMMVTSNSGAPGSEATIRIRGIGTVNNNDPVYVVDGVLIDNSDPKDPASNIAFLNPLDIENIEVLKDASAQAIYGSRGANGVILVTTKKGREGLPKATFSTSFGVGKVVRIPQMLNAEEYRNMILTSHYNGYLRNHPQAGPDILPDTLDDYTKYAVAGYGKGINTDWLHAVLKNRTINRNYFLSVSGGTKNAKYAASAGYLNQEGLIQKTGYQRYSFRLNTDFTLGKHVILGENLGITTATKRGPDYAVSYNNAFSAEPVTPVFKPKGSVDVNDPEYEYTKYQATFNGDNPVLAGEIENLKNVNLTLAGNMFAEVTFLKDLKIRSSWGINLAYRDETDFSPRFYLSNTVQNDVSTVSASNYRTNGWAWENTLTYSKTINDHAITALLGYTSEYATAIYQTANKKGTPGNYPELRTFDAATTEPNVTGGYNILTKASYLGRINYAFRDKYLLTASLRHDGSSKFGPGHRWGTFPSFSAGWNISRERFFSRLGGHLIGNLKIRAGWGRIGNSSLPVYSAYVSQVSSTPTDGWIDNRYIFGDKVYNGFYLTTIGTTDISWETSEQANLGIDIAVLNNALTITADYFIRNTKNMLLQVPVVNYSGYPASVAPYSNAGSVQNRGFEWMVAYRAKRGDFSFGASLNGSVFKNRVTSLGRGNKPVIYFANRTETGKPIGSFYGFKTDGIFQTEEEVQSYKGPDGTVLQPLAHAGDFRFKNLNADNVIDENDETWIGNPWPKLTYGFDLNLGYKAFYLDVFFQGSYGNDMYRADFQRSMGFLGYQNTFAYVARNAWSGPGSSESQPILSTTDLNHNYRNSDYFVEDASYLRLRNLQIGYNFPKTLCEKIRISRGRFWMGGSNLLTFTKFRGIDPENGASQTPTATEGYESLYTYPKTREITTGITLTF
jgi:TonB-dependent starch-binding outer membrane protein SusC